MKRWVPILLLTGFCAVSAVEPLEVYIFAGQSNMMAKGSTFDDLPSELKGRQDDAVFVFDKGSWEPLTPGPEQRFGPELSCASELSAKPDRPIGIIKHGKGGTNLTVDWNPDRPGSLYTALKQKVDAARQSRPIRIAGMFWMQGENDSKNQAMAEAYGENFEKLILRARRDFDSPDMRFVAGRVNPPQESFPYADQVRAAQEQCSVINYRYVDCDDLAKMKDRLHYSTPGLVELGRKFADAMME